MRRRAAILGTPPPAPPTISTRPPKSVDDAIGTNTANTIGDAIKEWVSGVSSQTQSFAKVASTWIAALAQATHAQDEESQMLWWVFGEHSISEGAMSKLGLGTCLVAAYDLASLTRFFPGPVSAVAFLDRMLTADEVGTIDETSVLQAVNATPRKWRETIVQESRSNLLILEDFCPIALATVRSTESPGPEEWVPVFEHLTGLKARDRVPKVELSLYAYYEYLLLRFYGASKS